MRVLFDGYWWVEGPISNQNVLHGIVTAWRASYPDDVLTVAIPARHCATRPGDLPSDIAVVTTRLRPHAMCAMLEMTRLARKVKPDAIVNQNFASLRGDSAVFLHDVIFRTNPEWFTAKERLYFSLMPLSAPRARLILASTRTEAKRIEREVRGVHTVVDVGIAPTDALLLCTPQPPPELDGLSGFTLCVGRFNPRKNLAVAVEAAVASGVLTAEQPLVVVGEGRYQDMPLSAAAQAAAEHGLVRFLPFVPNEQLAWLYSHAALMLFLSLDEGFGLPPVEALAFGCPVLVSDIAVFRETLGDHAVYADPRNVDAVAAKLRELAAAPNARTPYLGYSWQQTVERIRSALRS